MNKTSKNKIIINFLEGQGLGNQLWTLFAGIQISKILKTKIEFGGGKFFKGKFIIKQKINYNEINNSSYLFKVQETYDLITGLEVIDYKNMINFLKKKINETNIEILGSLQSTDLLPSKKIILSKIKKNKNYYNRDYLIHVRGGDFKNTIVKPSKKYYLSAINLLKKSKNNFNIITDDKNYSKKILPNIKIIESKINKFDMYTANHHKIGGLSKDFLYLVYSKINIIGPSTYAFWASYIGNCLKKNKIIIAPAYWNANRVSSSWWSPRKMIIKNWIYLDKSGKKIKRKKIAEPYFVTAIKLNKYLDFIRRKLFNYFLN